MEPAFINLTEENLPGEHLCCIIRSKKPHPGVEAKRQWLAARLKEGHVLRKLQVKAPVFIEYAPLETAWVPVEGPGYLYIYCLWVDPAWKGRGYGTALMDYCLAEARRQGKSGVCMLGADKQKAWLSDQGFARRFGFETVDRTDTGYELLALSIDGSRPRFTESARRGTIDETDLTVYYDNQCPFITQKVESLRTYSRETGFPVHLAEVDTLEKAKTLPCPFNNWAVFWQGQFQTVNLLDASWAEKLRKKANGGTAHGTD